MPRPSRFLRLPASRTDAAECVWVNQDWITRNIGKLSIGQARAWAMKNFAFRIAGSGAGENGCWFEVDRYGCTGFKRYGGSGRAGVINGLQVKGIGRTPLVDPMADNDHSHGWLSMREAIIEATFSAAGALAFPYGAVESVAIIRIPGFIAHDESVESGAALMVRPFQMRPCHLQRAVGFAGSDSRLPHLIDVVRVKENFAIYAESGGSLKSFASVLAAQVARSHLLRWFGGGFYSSNVCLNGKLIDFAASMMLTSWSRAPRDATGPAFGDEIPYAARMIESLAFYNGKYGGEILKDGELLHEFEFGYRNRILSDIALALGVEKSRVYEAQDRVYVKFTESFNDAQNSDDQAAREAEHESFAMVSEMVGLRGCKNDWRSALGFGEIDRDLIEERIKKIIESKTDDIQQLIDGAVQEFRSHGAQADG